MECNISNFDLCESGSQNGRTLCVSGFSTTSSFQAMIHNSFLPTLLVSFFLFALTDIEGLLHDSSMGSGEDAAANRPDVKIKMSVVSESNRQIANMYTG